MANRPSEPDIFLDPALSGAASLVTGPTQRIESKWRTVTPNRDNALPGESRRHLVLGRSDRPAQRDGAGRHRDLYPAGGDPALAILESPPTAQAETVMFSSSKASASASRRAISRRCIWQRWMSSSSRVDASAPHL